MLKKILCTSLLTRMNKVNNILINHAHNITAFYRKNIFLPSCAINTMYLKNHQASSLVKHFTLCPIREVPLKIDESDTEKIGFIKSLQNTIKMTFSIKPKRGMAAFVLYESCADLLDYNDFFKSCSLPDTLFSWFLIIELHVWMCQVRLMREGKLGRHMRNEITRAMWLDVETRMKQLTEMPSSQRREILEDLHGHFNAAMFSYDEGLMSDDRVLAAALWRTLFCYDCNDPEKIELMVAYVRRQLNHLDCIQRDEIFEGKLKWLPFSEAITLIR